MAHGGAAVFKVGLKDPNFGSLFDLFSVTFREPWVIQKFLPAVAEGDKRIILVDGEAKGAVNRVPAGRRHPLQHGARRRGEGDGPHPARARNLRNGSAPNSGGAACLFVGIDVIGGFLTEINVTSPTGIRAIKTLGGPDLAVAIWDAIEAKRVER